MSQLVLITSHFPYNPGEQFLESEIEHLARSFDRIYVVPIDLSHSDGTTRTLPANATLVDMARPGDPRVSGAARRAIRSLTERIARLGLPQHLALDLRFAVTALGFYERTAAALHDAGVDPATPTVTYGYWLFKQAAVASLLKEHYFTGQIRAVSRAHSYDAYPSRGIFGYLPARPYLSAHVDAVYPISRSAYDSILANTPFAADKLSIERLGTRAPGAEVTRAKGTPIRFLSCSSLASLKRVPDIARAMAELHRRRPGEFRWTHIGDSGEASAHELAALVNELGIADITTLIGQISNPDLFEHYATQPVDFFVNYSTTEGVPVSIMEAFSFAIPAIATNVGGTGELVRHADNGRLIPGDAAVGDLADALSSLIDMEPAEYDRLSAGARATWESMARADENYSHFAATLARLLEP
ncbi:glycosyltransferase [Trueperella abortisuis]|uniref:Glycosyltransferase involved in cell wall biosynthesis n=1 Tax=Trueperella abortisuis TaxID=445930 RepID=A0ABT9PI38_9ACTO|nr:glycosyltransferase [Trueperella abortisuis]MDP9831810.1 glycosyltransferase involved in cell wall biosynthesis [Trueperella abortisuis]